MLTIYVEDFEHEILSPILSDNENIFELFIQKWIAVYPLNVVKYIDIYDDRMEIYSPGGMPDGSMIQDRDPLTVPSTRRNPVLADVFNRLGYMERKGSGFGKIISGYEFQINYNEKTITQPFSIHSRSPVCRASIRSRRNCSGNHQAASGRN